MASILLGCFSLFLRLASFDFLGRISYNIILSELQAPWRLRWAFLGFGTICSLTYRAKNLVVSNLISRNLGDIYFAYNEVKENGKNYGCRWFEKRHGGDKK